MIITILAIGILIELLLILYLLTPNIYVVGLIMLFLPFVILFIVVIAIFNAVGFFDDKSRGEE
jgi:hypothetical protein